MKQGFTLTEMLVALTISGTLLTIGTISINPQDVIKETQRVTTKADCHTLNTVLQAAELKDNFKHDNDARHIIEALIAQGYISKCDYLTEEGQCRFIYVNNFFYPAQ